MEHSSIFEERRQAERTAVKKDAIYVWKKHESPCEIIDISSKGLKLRVKGILELGDDIDIKVGSQTIKAKVVHVEGNIVGVNFDQISDFQLNYLIKA